MKIAYVINSLEGGGAQSPIPCLFRVLEKHGVSVTLYALSRRNGLSIPNLDAAGISWHCFSGHKKQHFKAAKWLSSKLKADKPDIIWTSLTQATLIGQLLGKLSKTPVVSWQHNAFLKPVNHRLLSLTKSLSSLWVTDSKAVKALTVERFGLAPDKTLIWPLFYAKVDTLQAKHWTVKDTIKIASLGRLHPNKGYDVLIKAVAKLKADHTLPNFEINIAGEGAERDRLEDMKKDLGVTEINFIGYAEKPLAFLSEHHAYVQPSRFEGLAIAAHEAMQAGLPVLCTKMGQMGITVTDGVSGWLCETEDVDSLASALDRLLSSPESLSKVGDAMREKVLAEFSQERFDNAGKEFIDRLKPLVGNIPQ